MCNTSELAKLLGAVLVVRAASARAAEEADWSDPEHVGWHAHRGVVIARRAGKMPRSSGARAQ